MIALVTASPSSILDEALRLSKSRKGSKGPNLAKIRFDAVQSRAEKMAGFFKDMDSQKNEEELRNIFKSLTKDKDGKTVSPEEFARRIKGLYSPVLTGHPTFTKTPEESKILSEYFTSLAKNEKPTPGLTNRLKSAIKKGFKTPDIHSESAQALSAIKNYHEALKIAERIAIEVAQDTYPNDWDKIDYNLGSIYTWIPYDWDGRTDISWNFVLEKRCEHQALMLKDYKAELESLQSLLPRNALNKLLQKIDFTIDKDQDFQNFLSKYDAKADKHNAELARWSREEFVGTKKKRITHPDQIISVLEPLLAKTKDKEAKTALVHLISRMKNHGITIAHPHYRINAGQLVTALSQDEIKTAKLDNTVIKKLTTALKKQKSNPSNIVDVANSKQRAVTQTLLIRQIADDLDSHSTPRLLIAETHSAAHVLGAMYLAKKYGIENHAVISPLFEDNDGIVNAKEIVKKLFKNPEYRAYVEKTGIIPIEVGYSDSGRFVGPAALSLIEKAKGQIVSEAARHGIKADVLFFDTHGESIGRSAHPDGIPHRLASIFSPWLLNYAGKKGYNIIGEESIQGGDGYLFLSTPETCLHYMTQAFGHMGKARFAAPQEGAPSDDPFYDESRLKDTADAFYENVREHHTNLSSDADYSELINGFKNLLPRTGSRPVARDKESGGKRALPRAIPNNAILAQLAAWTNVIYGLGAAIEADTEGFDELMKTSETFRSRIAFARCAMERTDLNIIRSYIELYNPEFWSAQGNMTVAEEMKKTGIYESYHRIFTKMENDYLKLKPQLEKHFGKIPKPSDNIYDIHKQRLAEMVKVIGHAVHIPTPAEIPGNKIFAELANMSDIMLSDVNAAFETASNGHKKPNCGKPSKVGTLDYRKLKKDHLQPIANSFEIIKTHSLALADLYMAVG